MKYILITSIIFFKGYGDYFACVDKEHYSLHFMFIKLIENKQHNFQLGETKVCVFFKKNFYCISTINKLYNIGNKNKNNCIKISL